MRAVQSTIILGLFLAGSQTALADCVARYSTKFGDRSDGAISGAAVGKPCTVSHNLRTPGRGPSQTTLTAIEVVRQPHHGTVRASGSSFIYTPNSSFKGDDSFFIRFVFATGEGERRTSGVRFAVKN